MKTVNLNEAVVWIRELLYMNKTELFKTANLENPNNRIKKSDVLLYAFERKFNQKARDPSENITASKMQFKYRKIVDAKTHNST